MPAAANWQAALARQWRHHQILKVLGICGFTWIFFIGYFHVLRNPLRPVTVMPLTPLDGWIDFHPWAIWPYASLWIYVGVAPALLPTLHALARYGAWVAALCASGLVCFLLWPTAVPPPGSEVSAAVAEFASLAVLRGVDAAGNACPSLHVATAVFGACWNHRLLSALGTPGWLRAISLSWLLAIVWSTVALRQHVVIDVAAGVALGWLFAALSLRYGPAPRAAPGVERL